MFYNSTWTTFCLVSTACTNQTQSIWRGSTVLSLLHERRRYPAVGSSSGTVSRGGGERGGRREGKREWGEREREREREEWRGEGENYPLYFSLTSNITNITITEEHGILQLQGFQLNCVYGCGTSDRVTLLFPSVTHGTGDTTKKSVCGSLEHPGWTHRWKRAHTRGALITSSTVTPGEKYPKSFTWSTRNLKINQRYNRSQLSEMFW